jgi:HEAT repeat protein
METDWLGPLLRDVGGEDGSARLRARETLAAIGEPSLGSLIGLLGSPEPRLRWEAAKALTEIPEPAAIPGLISLLEDRRTEIGWLAAVGLINLGNRSVPYVLQALTEHAGSKAFRQASHHVFHDLSARNGVLRDILEPVLDALGDAAPDAGIISSRAEAALQALRALSGG